LQLVVAVHAKNSLWSISEASKDCPVNKVSMAQMELLARMVLPVSMAQMELLARMVPLHH
jgi:hypothetical protein